MVFSQLDLMNCTGVPIDQAVIFPIPVFTNPANASFSLCHAAAVRAQFTLDFSSPQRSEIGRKFCLNETLLRHLCTGSLRKAEEVGGGEYAETCPTKF